jgi:hypothetical protein
MRGDKLAKEIARLREQVEDHERRLTKLEGRPVRVARTATGIKASLEGLVESGFFRQKKSIAAAANELRRLGNNVRTTDISGHMRDLVRARRLDRVKEKLDGRFQWMYLSR